MKSEPDLKCNGEIITELKVIPRPKVKMKISGRSMKSVLIAVRVVLIILSLFSTIMGFDQKQKPAPPVETSVPVAAKIPAPSDSVTVIENVRLSISSYFWKDFMPAVPPAGPPFYLSILIQFKNQSAQPLNSFSVEKVSLYFAGSRKLFHTFQLISEGNNTASEKIAKGETKILRYTNTRERLFTGKIERGTQLYGRIRVHLNGKTFDLSIPPSPVHFTY